MLKVIDGAKPWVFAYLTNDDLNEAIDYTLSNKHACLRIDYDGLDVRNLDRLWSDPRVANIQYVHVVSVGKSLDSLAKFVGLRQISFAIPVDSFDFRAFLICKRLVTSGQRDGMV